MLDARWRRPVELASSVSSDGPFSETTPSEPQFIPGTLATCPTPCTPRPRNEVEFKTACRVAQGEPVAEHSACEIVPGMHVYHGGQFLEVVGIDRHDPHADVELQLAGGDLYVIRIVPVTAPVYVLAPTPDACHAPGAGASADESTGALR